MAYFDERDVPEEWDNGEFELYSDLVGGEPEIGLDAELQDLFDAALFDLDLSPEERADAYDDLIDYLWDEYGIDFDADFDWEGYREWYDSAA